MLEEDHRIVVPYGLNQETLGLVWGRRQHDLEARDVGEQRIEALAVLRGCAKASAVHRAYDQGRDRFAAEHVTELRRLIEDLVEAHPHEVDEHELGHWPEAGRGCARRRSDERAFGDRGVEYALGAELRI